MRIFAHTAVVASVLTFGSIAAFSAQSATDEAQVAYVDHHAIHACYARASHSLEAQGLEVSGVERELMAHRQGAAWLIDGQLNAEGPEGRDAYAVSCAVGPEGIAFNVARAAKGA